MNYGAGSVFICARRAGVRTILERVRYDGISRCSRAFHSEGAATVVLSQLGPGVVRGDRTTVSGQLQPAAHLIVTSQTATRLMGGTRRAEFHASWTVAHGAVLELIGEPLVAVNNAHYEAAINIELKPGASALLTDVVCVPADAKVRLRTSIRSAAGRELFYDAFDPAQSALQAIGTFVLVGLHADCVDRLIAALDAKAHTRCALRLGIGMLRGGAFARVLGKDVWTVRSALGALRQAAIPTLNAAQSLDE